MDASLSAQLGCEAEVLVDRAGAGLGVARLWSQAPEIDGQVLVRGDVSAGSFARVRLTGVRGPDCEAVPV